ncbi:tRNA (adenosine(37)-N6)-threonylcarbamoyltransferase complex dimerization subunit type 1 TsaB [Tenacibaculum sp. M341]|uniref:tRNA (adenosine(37)-N6)-threonylcarbamoyltransferase complex dimerization subunit type 1 TsaB n=1 Tax=Tenacibaculum sp. M341 TaxID=2530339 RepID=UPI00104D4003|nr:tRNA (adenosine(37)-N6)-threonylcarbamoyltransferase complex dimerization subunit type 1 TsaB [Tenacibaculum sp. M341]TCI84946.1 tRNA (adenosine(37)-N6)-threonylcarbamoyltransferase complex dimerization subunit type 1 TsaB [Tenacibaculum sp. M341]
MALILNIETSTKNCSVCLAKDGNVLLLKELNDGNYSHAEKLHVLIKEVIEESDFTKQDINAIAVSKGPGSYTGLRIGVSAAKGLSFSLNIPLISVETLTSLAHATTIENGYIIPMLDARRMEVYSAVYDQNYNKVRDIQAQIIDETSFSEYDDHKLYFLGDGAAKCKEVLEVKNVSFIEDHFPSAKEMAQLSYDKYKKNDIEDVAYFEPFYLKDFIVTTEKKKN